MREGPDPSRVEQLYHAARERPAAEQEAFLAEACGDDLALLREVTSLLRQAKDAARILEKPVAEEATQPLAIVRGTRLGPYEVAELLGVGGMGEVYRARDTRLGRDVAVKILPRSVAEDPRRHELFEREARAVAALNHPNVLTVHDVGRHDGVPYVVTEPLQDPLRDGSRRLRALPTAPPAGGVGEQTVLVLPMRWRAVRGSTNRDDHARAPFTHWATRAGAT